MGGAIALFAASAVSRFFYTTKSPTKAASLTSLSALRGELDTLQQRHVHTLKAQPGISEVEVIRQSTLGAAVESSALSFGAPTGFSAPVKALITATTPAAARQAQAQLVEAINAGHQQAQMANFEVVAKKAFEKVGFASVEKVPGREGLVRLVGRDEGGRTLVTEFESHLERGESLASEVVGVCHNKSEELLDAFEKALEEEGVVGLPPTRKKTGGVAQLDVAREFIRRPVTKATLREAVITPASTKKAGHQRLQQNNQRNRQGQR
ncbi:MAG: hypothetical protein AB7Q37_03285 [Pyrinomonadaceae bacterium]